VIAPWLYSEYLGHLIHRWKYSGDLGMTPLLAELWRQRAQPTPVDLLVPVPLHWWRQWRRGFNQSELLAQRLHQVCPELSTSAIDTHLLKRHRATAVQSGSNARDRAGNLRGAFTVTRPCDNLRIAVIDDVLTTGATATEIARALAKAGASHIEIWCLARTPAPGA
jgi:ComF family protein